MTANLIDFLPLYKLTHKHVLITGASGLIGSAIVEMLIKYTSAEVYAMFRDNSSNIKIMRGFTLLLEISMNR